MTTKKQRNMIEYAAKACEITREREISGKKPHRLIEHESGEGRISAPWNPLTNPADTAEMCAKLGIDWINSVDSVISVSAEYDCEAFLKDHDNSHLKAWMYAATMCAAKTQGYEDEA